MKRLAAAALVTTALLVLLSFSRHLGHHKIQEKPTSAVPAASGPELAGRVVVAALLRADQLTARAWSAIDVSSAPRSPFDPRDLSVTTYLLRRVGARALVAVEVHGATGEVSAVTLETAMVGGRWRVVGVTR